MFSNSFMSLFCGTQPAPSAWDEASQLRAEGTIPSLAWWQCWAWFAHIWLALSAARVQCWLVLNILLSRTPSHSEEDQSLPCLAFSNSLRNKTSDVSRIWMCTCQNYSVVNSKTWLSCLHVSIYYQLKQWGYWLASSFCSMITCLS